MKKITFSVVAILLISCGPSESIDSLPVAKALVEKFVQNYKNEDYEALDDLYGEEFWNSMPKNVWDRFLPNMKAELGPLKSCELSDFNKGVTISASLGSGNNMTLKYNCIHEKYESSMVFRVFDPFDGEKARILAHSVYSIGFLIE